MARPRLVIGIDYGTTNTGVAYAVVNDPHDASPEIQVIRKWPHSGRRLDGSDKVPSDIAYDDTGQMVGCGFEVPPGAQRLQWVKLLLERGLPEYFNKHETSNREKLIRTYNQLDRLGKKPIDAIADYLTWLWTFTQTKIKEREGDDVFDRSDATVVMTLPACWSLDAGNRMQQAAHKAGIAADGRTLRFRMEPEAAAIFELKALAGRRKIGKGDCVIVCDAGGGTVDVVSYELVSERLPLEPLSLRQVGECKADFCGSAVIDSEFETQLTEMLRPVYHDLPVEAITLIWETFEYNIKRTFSAEQPFTYTIPILGTTNVQHPNITNGRLELVKADIEAAFESAWTQISNLIDGQKRELDSRNLANMLKGILIVGGFGQSDYLKSRIEQEHPTTDPVQVWQGDQSWTAVVQGAVAGALGIDGRDDTIHTRLSGYNYGIPYREGSDRKVQWLIRKGQSFQISSTTEAFVVKIQEQDWFEEDTHATLIIPLVRTNDVDPSDFLDESVVAYAELRLRIPTSIRHSSKATLIQRNPKVWTVPAELILAIQGPVLSIKCRIQGDHVGIVELQYPDTVPELSTRDSKVSLVPVHQQQEPDDDSRSKTPIDSVTSIEKATPGTSTETTSLLTAQPITSSETSLESPRSSKLKKLYPVRTKSRGSADKLKDRKRSSVASDPVRSSFIGQTRNYVP